MSIAELNGEHIALAVTTLIGIIMKALLTCVTAYFQWQAKKDVSDINDAVNHRHIKKGNDALKLYDLVWENHLKSTELIEWKRTYDGGPLDSGTKVEDFFDSTTKRLETLSSDIAKINESCPEGGRLPCHWMTHQQKMKGSEADAKRKET